MHAPKANIRTVPYTNFSSQFQDEREDILAITERVFASGQFIAGAEVSQLEEKWAAYCGVKHAVAVNSGTDALILALIAAGIGRGDEVITTPNSFIASTAAICHLGARPVFVDVLPDQNIDCSKIEPAITPKTKAIMPVHLTGRVCDMESISAIAQRKGLAVIEDAAQAAGSAFKGRKSGSWGDYGCFSCHPLKNLNAAGDGGLITTNNSAAVDRLKRIRNHGLADRNTVLEWGLNSRLDTLQAAYLLYRIEKIDAIAVKRRANANLYRQLLDARFVFSPPCREQEFNTFHTFVIQTERRDELQKYLSDHGVGTAIHYPVPIHLQPAAAALGYKAGQFPVTEQQAKRILTLPIHQYLVDDDIRYTADLVNRFFGSAQ